MVNLLDDLPDIDEPSGWSRSSSLAQIQSQHHRIIAGLVDLAVGD
jgi:hypothetical protein